HAVVACVELTFGLEVFLPYGSVGRVERGAGEVPHCRLVPRQSSIERGNRDQLPYREDLRPRVLVCDDVGLQKVFLHHHIAVYEDDQLTAGRLDGSRSEEHTSELQSRE